MIPNCVSLFGQSGLRRLLFEQSAQPAKVVLAEMHGRG